MSNIDKPPPPLGRPINNNNNSDNNVINNQPPPPTNPRPNTIIKSTNPFDDNEIESTDEDINMYTNKPNHSNSFDQIDRKKQRSASITITPFTQQSIDYYTQDISKTQLLNQLNKNDNNSTNISIIDVEKPTMKYIQLYNIDGDPFYLDVTFGTVWWLLPDDIDFNDVIIISHEHFDENDFRSLYYEYIDTNNNKIVAWDPPYELLSNESIIMLHDVINMNRKDIERLTNQLFNHELSENLLIRLEEFLLEKEENTELEDTSIDNKQTNDFTKDVDSDLVNKIDSKRNSLAISNDSSRRNSFIINNLDSYIDSERSSSIDDNIDSQIDNQLDDKINSKINIEIDSQHDSKIDNKRSTSILNERSNSYKSFNNQSINQVSTVSSNSNSNRNNSITRRLNTLDSLVSKLFKSIDFSDDESDDQIDSKVTINSINKQTLESIDNQKDNQLEKPIDCHRDSSLDNQLDSQLDKQVDPQSVRQLDNQLSNQLDNEAIITDNNLINELTNQNNQLVNQIIELQNYLLEIISNIPDSNNYLSNESTNYKMISNHIITSIQQLQTNKLTNEQEIKILESKLSDQLIYYNTKLTNESNINKQLTNQIKQLNELVNQLDTKNQSLDKQINNLQYQLDKQLDINISSSPMVTTTKPNRFSFLLDKSIDTNNELSNEMKASDSTTTNSTNDLINDQIVELKKQVNELTNQLSNLNIQHRKQIDINKKLSIDKDITTTLSDYPINQLTNQSANQLTTLDSTNYLRRNIYLSNYLSSYPINYLSNHLSNKLLNYLSIPITQFFPLELTLCDYIHRILSILSYAIRETIGISNNSNSLIEFYTIDRYIDMLYNDLTITSDMQSNCLYIYQWIRYVNILDSVIDSGRLIDLNHLFHTVKQLLHQLIAYSTDKPARRLSHTKSDSKSDNKLDSKIDSKTDNKIDKKQELIHLAITVLSQVESQYNYHMEFKDKRMYTYGWLYERAIDKDPSANFPQELITITKQSNINTRRNSIRRDSSYNYQSNESNKLSTSNSTSSINHSFDSMSNYQSLNKSSDSQLDNMSNYPTVSQLPTNSPSYLSTQTTNPIINFINQSTNQSVNPTTQSSNRLDSKVDTIVLESLRAKLIASLSTKEIATTKLVIRLVSLYQAISKIACSFNNKLDSKLDSKMDNQLDSLIESHFDDSIDNNESYRQIISKLHSKLLNTLIQLDMIVKPTNRETNNLSSYQSYDWYMNHYQLASNHKLLKQSLAIIQSYQLSNYTSNESPNYLSNQLTNNLTTIQSVDSNNYQDIVSLHTRLQQLLQPIDINEYTETIRYIDISNLSNTLFYHVNTFDNQCIASLVITIQSNQIVRHLIDLFDNLIVKTSTNEFIPLNQLDISKLDLSDTRSLRSFGFPSNVLIMSNSFTNDEILLAQYPLNELIGISFNVKQLYLSGYTVKDCKSINIDIQDIRNGGYTDYDLITSKCYQWNELLNHGIDIQRYILIDLYMKCNGKYWKRKLNWNTNYPLATWQGVHINGRGYVYKLDLKSNHLTGYIPDSLYLLKHLEYLDISYNLLYGNIDSNIKYLKQLKDLFINNNKLNINATTRPMLQAYLPKCCIRM